MKNVKKRSTTSDELYYNLHIEGGEGRVWDRYVTGNLCNQALHVMT